MDILLSHETALAVLRLPLMARRLERGERCDAHVPQAPPTPEEVESLLRLLPVLAVRGGPVDVLVASAEVRVRSQLVSSHVWSAQLPPGSAVAVVPGMRCVSPEHLVVQMTPALTDLELMVLLAELLGSYAVDPNVKRGMAQRERPIMTPERLLAHLSDLGPVSGCARIRRALGMVCVGAASPRETKLSLRLGLKPALGGYHLPVLSMNEPMEVRRIHDAMRGGVRKPDILLLAPGGPPDASKPFCGRAVEYEGEDHRDPRRLAANVARHNELVALGFGEYWVAKEQYGNLSYMDGLAGRLRADLGMAPLRLSDEEATRRRALRLGLYEELERIDGTHWGGRARERERAATTTFALPAAKEDWDVVLVDAYGLG